MPAAEEIEIVIGRSGITFLAPLFYSSVSCSSSMFCGAVGESGAALSYDDAAWILLGKIDEETGIESVSCVSSSFCVAVDLEGDALICCSAAPPPVALLALSLSGLTETARVWREGNALAHITAKRTKRNRKGPPLGTTFSFSLNEQALVSFRFTKQVTGREVGHKCVAKIRKNRKRRACKRTVITGTLTFTGHGGTNKVVFQGRVTSSKKLEPGHYTLMVTAANSAGQKSTPQKLSFTIVR